MRTILAAFVVIAAAPVAWAQSPWTVTSPDGRTTISVARQADGRLLWRVMRDNGPILADSPLGVRRADQAFDADLTFVRASDTRAIDERYTLPHGKRRDQVMDKDPGRRASCGTGQRIASSRARRRPSRRPTR